MSSTSPPNTSHPTPPVIISPDTGFPIPVPYQSPVPVQSPFQVQSPVPVQSPFQTQSPVPVQSQFQTQSPVQVQSQFQVNPMSVSDQIIDLVRHSDFLPENPEIATHVLYSLLKNSVSQVKSILTVFSEYDITSFTDFQAIFDNSLVAEWSSPTYHTRLGRVIIQRLQLVKYWYETQVTIPDDSVWMSISEYEWNDFARSRSGLMSPASFPMNPVPQSGPGSYPSSSSTVSTPGIANPPSMIHTSAHLSSVAPSVHHLSASPQAPRFAHVNLATPAPHTPHHSAPPAYPASKDPAAIFRKGIKLDPTLYPVLTDDRNWPKFIREFEAIADLQQIARLLDTSFQPNNLDPVDYQLFLAQQQYMYPILLRCLKTDKGRELITRFQSSRDAHRILMGYRYHMQHSPVAAAEIRRLITLITTTRIETWKGSTYSFLTYF
jgi:hypothetical protein